MCVCMTESSHCCAFSFGRESANNAGNTNQTHTRTYQKRPKRAHAKKEKWHDEEVKNHVKARTDRVETEVEQDTYINRKKNAHEKDNTLKRATEKKGREGWRDCNGTLKPNEKTKTQRNMM